MGAPPNKLLAHFWFFHYDDGIFCRASFIRLPDTYIGGQLELTKLGRFA
jgi:hypothetical protein